MAKADEGEKKHSDVRYPLIFGILVCIYCSTLITTAIFTCGKNFENARIKEHLALYQSSKEKKETFSTHVFLYSVSGPVEVEREVERYGSDDLHLVLEALLQPVNEKELENGLTSYIAKNTSLIGISESYGSIFAELSNDLMFSSNLDRALEQIVCTIENYCHPVDITIISDGVVIYES